MAPADPDPLAIDPSATSSSASTSPPDVSTEAGASAFLDQYGASIIEDELHEAERDINTFTEFVLKDEAGRAVTQAPIHRAWHAHIDWCHAHEKHAGIVAPWGHGKTEQVIIARILWRLGQNQNMRIKMISNTDDNASIRILAIERYIEQNADLKLVFPNLRQDKRGVWSSERFQVMRTAHSKDASLEGFGIISTRGLGSRADEIFFDDVCDLKDITEPSTRDKKDHAFFKTWMSRRVDGAPVTYIATAWHDKDLTHRLRANPNWSFLWMGVSDDCERINCELYGADRTHPLFPPWMDASEDAEAEAGR